VAKAGKSPPKSFVCQSCGATYPKWTGKCDACGEWNTLIEEKGAGTLPKGVSGGKGGQKIAFVGLKGETAAAPRLTTGITELDRVSGATVVADTLTRFRATPGFPAFRDARTPAGDVQSPAGD